MRSNRMWLIGAGVAAVIVVLGALIWQQQSAPPPPPIAPAATAVPSPTVPPPSPPATAAPATAAPEPTATTPAPATRPPLPATAAGELFLGDGVTITLPVGWVGALRPDPAALGFNDANGAPLLAAWQDAPTYDDAAARMTLIRVPRAGIPLATFLADLAATTDALPGFSVSSQVITDTLRSDGLPAGLLRFSQAEPSGAGWQAALLDATGENLLLLTFAADASASDPEAQFRALVASIVFE
jgi:hypothetical protein